MSHQMPKRMHTASVRPTIISRAVQKVTHPKRATVLVTLAVTVSVAVAVTVKVTLTVLVA